MRKFDAAFAAATMLLGAWVAYGAIGYGYSSEGNPGPGFFPFWVGLAMVVLGAVNGFRALSGTEQLSDSFDRTATLKTAAITVAIAAFLALAPYLGMLLGSGLLVLAVGYAIRPTRELAFTARLFAVAVGFPLAAYVIFSVYLNVRLVEGAMGF